MFEPQIVVYAGEVYEVELSECSPVKVRGKVIDKVTRRVATFSWGVHDHDPTLCSRDLLLSEGRVAILRVVINQAAVAELKHTL